jgi:pimeloyl-ACP methyl ester carboxylesterase
MQAHTIIGGGGMRLHVDETGNPHGRPMVFLHGFSQCRLAWRKQMASDLANDFRLLAMDLRGHGLSGKPRDAYGEMQLWAEDVDAVMRTLGLHQPVLCGWSYGGVVICDYLSTYGEDAIAGINLVGGITTLESETAMAVVSPAFFALVPGLFSTDVEESVHALQDFLRLCTYAELTPAEWYAWLGYNVSVPPYVRQGLLSRVAVHRPLLPRLRKPVLITHGDADAIILRGAAEQHAAAIPQAQTSFYPHVGHAPFWEDAPRFNRELRAFVASLPS